MPFVSWLSYFFSGVKVYFLVKVHPYALLLLLTPSYNMIFPEVFPTAIILYLELKAKQDTESFPTSNLSKTDMNSLSNL